MATTDTQELNRKHRILFVDDDRDTCELMTVLFPDHEVRTAPTAAAGLLLAKNSSFDLYLLDRWLSDGSGIELCKKIRSFDRNAPIVFLSGAVQDEDHIEAIEAGATAYLNKPAELLGLRQTVASLIRQSEMNSLVALTAEINAIRESLGEHLADLELRLEKANARVYLAKERLVIALAEKQELSDKAYSVFTNAGGARAHFDHLWTAALNEVV